MRGISVLGGNRWGFDEVVEYLGVSKNSGVFYSYLY